LFSSEPSIFALRRRRLVSIAPFPPSFLRRRKMLGSFSPTFVTQKEAGLCAPFHPQAFEQTRYKSRVMPYVQCQFPPPPLNVWKDPSAFFPNKKRSSLSLIIFLSNLFCRPFRPFSAVSFSTLSLPPLCFLRGKSSSDVRTSSLPP